MKNFSALTVLTTLLVLAACSTVSEAPMEKAKFKTYSAEDFYQTTSYFGSSFSADDKKILIGSDESGIFNLYTIDIETGTQTPLTTFSDTTYPVSWFPNDDRVLFTKDSGGNELYHVFVRELDGSHRDLTPGENNRAGFVGFVQDGQYFYITSNKRDAKLMDVYRYDAKTYESELVFANDAAYSVGDIDKHGQYLSLSKSHSNKNSDVYLLNLNKPGAEPQIITPHTEPTQYEPEAFSPDGRTFYYRTNGSGEFYQIWSYNIATGERDLEESADWDVSFLAFTENGKYRVSGVNADARMKIKVVETATGREVKMPPLAAGDLRGLSFTKDESTMSFYINSDVSPSNLYVWPVGKPKANVYTQALSENVNQQNLVASEVVRFKSFDGLEIPGILYKPKQANASTPVPALVYVHGGPGGQSRTGYSPRNQHLVNNGYAIFMVNNRGSSGYGKTFFHLDDRDHGGGDLQDIVYGKKYLEGLDWVDNTKIGIIGGSYGGFMTAAAMAFEPDEFKVGIEIFGVTNWVRTLNSIPPWWEAFKESLYDEMGDPATDGERHRAISPLFHAQNIKNPLMVIQGANDPRVLKVESDQLVEKVKENGVPVNYVVFDDEGHGFTKKKNRITASNAYLAFLEKYLRNAE